MSMVGRLEDLALPDILQILSLGKKTGKLTLTRREGTGMILFHQGQVTYAASDSVRETLGNILVCKKLITEATLTAALEAQHKSPEGTLLGAILLERGYITKEALEKSIRQQIERVVFELFTWHTGFFKFELMDLEESDGLHVDTREFLLRAGLSPEYLLLEATRRKDEERARPAAAPAAAAQAPAAATPRGPRPPAPNGQGAPRGADGQAEAPRGVTGNPGALSELRSILQEIRSPNFTGEITLMLMRYAAKLVSRGVFFVMKSDGICGMGQFGLGDGGPGADERVRRIKVPPNQPSIFSEVLEKRQTYLGPLTKSPADRRLLEEMGGGAPRMVLAIPMIVNNTVVAILYGDNVGSGRPIDEIEGLELLMNQAGLAMERALLEQKLKDFERRLAAASAFRQ